ncbi:MAG: hypothetical protein Q4Q07_10220 [Tissierellia bacterium]|nr:hypothetical protein [Tissierellia bacterium]
MDYNIELFSLNIGHIKDSTIIQNNGNIYYINTFRYRRLKTKGAGYVHIENPNAAVKYFQTISKYVHNRNALFDLSLGYGPISISIPIEAVEMGSIQRSSRASN